MPSDPLTHFAGNAANEALVKVMQDGIALIRADFPADDPDQIVAVVQSVFGRLNATTTVITAQGIYQGYRTARAA